MKCSQAARPRNAEGLRYSGSLASGVIIIMPQEYYYSGNNYFTPKGDSDPN